jgi:hypothetical protein
VETIDLKRFAVSDLLVVGEELLECVDRSLLLHHYWSEYRSYCSMHQEYSSDSLDSAQTEVTKYPFY